MIETPTLFILGAGASAPYGYPTGIGLWERIVGIYPEDSTIPRGYRKPFREFHSTYLGDNVHNEPEREPLIENLELFHETFFHADPSIDRFISRNRRFDELGKKAILTMLFHAEQFSSFPATLKDRSGDWLTYLLQKMTGELVNQTQFPQFHDNKVSFITFNYDRSLEALTHLYLSNSFSELPIEEINDAVDGLDILHVNGVLAPLDWQINDGVKQAYRKSFKTVDIDSHVENIQIIYDEQQDEITKKIEEKIKWAKRIYILGLGYADENMKLLGFPDALTGEMRIIGTTKGLTTHEVNDIMSRYFRPNVHYSLLMKDCTELLRDHINEGANR